MLYFYYPQWTLGYLGHVEMNALAYADDFILSGIKQV